MNRTPGGKAYEAVFLDVLRQAAQQPGSVRALQPGLWAADSTYFHGYDLGINTSVAETVCRDKYLTTLLLGEAGLPVSESHLFVGSRRYTFKREPSDATLPKVYALVQKHGAVVVKPVDGMGGRDVVKVRSARDVDNALPLFARTVVVSPFLPIATEFRLILCRLDPAAPPELLLCLSKRPLTVRGDGVRTLLALALEKLSSVRPGVRLSDVLDEIVAEYPNELHRVLDAGRELPITWRLNQSLGAITQVHVPAPQLLELALSAFAALDLRFGCVDIVEHAPAAAAGGPERRHTVLELNTAVLTDLFDYCPEDAVAALVRRALEFRRRPTPVQPGLGHVDIPASHPGPHAPVKTYQDRARLRTACLAAICADLGVDLRLVSHDYLAVLRGRPDGAGGDTRRAFVVNFDVGLNSSASASLCSDKAATAAVLRDRGIPCVAHVPFSRSDPSADPADGLLTRLVRQANAWNPTAASGTPLDVVLKPRHGSGGEGVVRIRSLGALESAVLQPSQRGLVLSPYYEIGTEFRLLCLDGVVVCAYQKVRPFVEGDGATRLADLVRAKYGSQPAAYEQIARRLAEEGQDQDYVPPPHRIVTLSWRHNLDQGAMPEPVEPDVRMRLSPLACRAASALGLRNCAVDIIRVGTPPAPVEDLVLEVNSTPTYYNFITFYGPEYFNTLFSRVIASSFTSAPAPVAH